MRSSNHSNNPDRPETMPLHNDIPILELYRSSLFLLTEEIIEIFNPEKVVTIGRGGYDIAQCLRARGIQVWHQWATGNGHKDSANTGRYELANHDFRDIDIIIIAPYLISAELYPDHPEEGAHLEDSSPQRDGSPRDTNSSDPDDNIRNQVSRQLDEYMDDYGPPTMGSLLCIPPPYWISGIQLTGTGREPGGHSSTGKYVKTNLARTEIRDAESDDDLRRINYLTKQVGIETTDTLLRYGQHKTSYHLLGQHAEWSVYAYMSFKRLDWYADLLQKMLEDTQLIRHQAEFELEHLKKAFSDAQLSRSWKIAYKLAGILYHNKMSDPT